MSNYRGCPRCGERSLEALHSYSHCINCLYSEDRYESLESHYFKALKEIKNIQAPEPEQENRKEILKFKKLENEEQNENKNCA